MRHLVHTSVLAALVFAGANAQATPGPACDAGACIDGDGDGFPSCACAAAGMRCDCDDANPSRYPGAPEACDSPRDDDCSGFAGTGCARGFGCFASVCVAECIPLDDFGCDLRAPCMTQPTGPRLCVPRDCTVFGCPAGSTCDDAKQCVPNCHAGVKCPFGQRCRGFGCVDPCAGVVCAAGAACTDGVCAPACDCPGAPCSAGTTCDPARGTCVETTCIGIACPAGAHCEDGACVDDCRDVVCPPKLVCRVAGDPAQGRCVDLCNPSPCASTDTCDWRTGVCIPLPPADGGLAEVPRLDERPFDTVEGGGGCNTAGAPALSFAALALAALVAAVARKIR